MEANGEDRFKLNHRTSYENVFLSSQATKAVFPNGKGVCQASSVHLCNHQHIYAHDYIGKKTDDAFLKFDKAAETK